MQKYPAVILHKNKTQAVKRFHPWVFSGAVKSREGNPDQGDVVEVYSETGEYLGIGHFGTGSVSVRIFSFDKITSLDELWRQKLMNAFMLRRNIGLTESKITNAYRLVNAEGDGVPGLIIDWYNGTAVVQCHSKAMHAEKEKFVEILKQGYGDRLHAVYDKSTATMHHKPGSEGDLATAAKQSDGYLYGTPQEKIALENNHKFAIDWVQGQKTGFFIDQRDNRQLLSKYVQGKKVLNTFCYSGGFSVYALKAGAALVHSVDSSVKAIDLTNENVKLNQLEGTHQSYAEDVFDFMKASNEEYDVIVLDPPAFAKGQSARHHAIQAYTRLNHAAFKKVKKGGIVFTFSCSQVVDREMFTGAVTSAAIDSKRNIKVLHHVSQPADHPVSIFNPEGLYLKGMVVYVE
ncbi:MAG TPA: class I SAM-dependent rRNA methyltransferase [Chitinophagales bacterium]|nr:class I SAM-dependent rRNA methyltransferase [Chitinophagales bacterium]